MLAYDRGYDGGILPTKPQPPTHTFSEGFAGLQVHDASDHCDLCGSNNWHNGAATITNGVIGDMWVLISQCIGMRRFTPLWPLAKYGIWLLYLAIDEQVC